MTIMDGLIQEIQYLPHGQSSEPDGIYQQIGGQLQPSGEHIFASKTYMQSTKKERKTKKKRPPNNVQDK